MERPQRRTRRLELRPYRDSDWRSWRAAYVDRLPAQDRWDLDPLPPSQCTRAEFRALRRRHRELAARDETYVWGVFTRRGRLVGVVDVFVICRDDRQWGNLGYQIHNRFRRRGYGREAALAGLHLAFEALGLNRVEAVVDVDNEASLRLLRGLPMSELGVQEAYLYEDGAWVDQVVFQASPPDLDLPRRAPPTPPG